MHLIVILIINSSISEKEGDRPGSPLHSVIPVITLRRRSRFIGTGVILRGDNQSNLAETKQTLMSSSMKYRQQTDR